MVNKRINKITNYVQDRASPAWKKICEYIDKVADENLDEFAPFHFLGAEMYSQIYTLPETISKLKSVKKVDLYGSDLKRIPPEIGEMTSLEYFCPYTSYNLHWFPYEIIYCKNLKDSTVSTRALYGNYKHRMDFPSLTRNPFRYEGAIVKCSICRKEMTYQETNQLWISLKIGTDVLPLLTNLCSKECEEQLPHPPEGYLSYPHKGGSKLKQPTYEEWEKANVVKFTLEDIDKLAKEEAKNKPKLLKLIRKIWEKYSNYKGYCKPVLAGLTI